MMKRQSAIVIGGSMAGLLAARVLSDYFETVTVIERDRLPDDIAYRNGVPQARHLHTLLARGQQIMDKFFPGFTADLTEAGAPVGHWGIDSAFLTTGGWTQQYKSGLVTNITARANLEYLVRRRVDRLPNVHFFTEREVLNLLTTPDKKTVNGVRVRSRIDQGEDDLYADLVVDASGRRSDAPDWLTALGYDAPETTIINAHTGYASRWFEQPEGTRNIGLAIQARPGEGLYRGGGLLTVEGRRWCVTLIGANGDYPPTDEEGFMAFARSLASPVLYELMKTATPISPIYGYRKLENQHRHYEKLTRRPENFIVTGDAFCALNPIYGQGMTTAALDADALDGVLSAFAGRSLAGFAETFHRKLAKVVSGPWLMATSEDLRYPAVEGDKPGVQTRLIHRYFDLLARAMPYDTTVTTAFFRAMNLLDAPASLLRPAIAARVLWHTLLRAPAPVSKGLPFAPLTAEMA